MQDGSTQATFCRPTYFHLRCPHCSATQDAARRRLYTASGWVPLVCKRCGRSSNSRTWSCTCSKPWPTCSVHQPHGYACIGTHPPIVAAKERRRNSKRKRIRQRRFSMKRPLCRTLAKRCLGRPRRGRHIMGRVDEASTTVCGEKERAACSSDPCATKRVRLSCSVPTDCIRTLTSAAIPSDQVAQPSVSEHTHAKRAEDVLDAPTAQHSA